MKKLLSILVIALLSILFTQAQSNDPLWMRYPAISPDGKTIVGYGNNSESSTAAWIAFLPNGLGNS